MKNRRVFGSLELLFTFICHEWLCGGSRAERRIVENIMLQIIKAQLDRLKPKYTVKLIIALLKLVLGIGIIFAGYKAVTYYIAISSANATAIAEAMAKAVSNSEAKAKAMVIIPSTFTADGSDKNSRMQVSQSFQSVSQACWYYQANYKNSGSYMVIDDEKENDKKEKKYPLLRVIAYEAYWKGEDCRKVDEMMALIGSERTLHRIEVKLTPSDDYTHIANGYLMYRSTMTFNDNDADKTVTTGTIYQRKIIKDPFDCDIVPYKNMSLSTFELFNKTSGAPERRDCGFDLDSSGQDQKDTKSDYYNIVKIMPSSEKISIEDLKEGGKYAGIIKNYVEQRKEVHTKLSINGCGVVTTGPDTMSANHSRPMIIFLCPNHIRIMTRE